MACGIKINLSFVHRKYLSLVWHIMVIAVVQHRKNREPIDAELPRRTCNCNDHCIRKFAFIQSTNTYIQCSAIVQID